MQVFQVRNVKNSAFFLFFFSKMFVYLKSYINFEEIIKHKTHEST